MERSKKKWNSLMLAWSAWMADRHPRPLRPTSRYNYISRVNVMSAIAERNGVSILAADLRTVRFVLGHLSPHPSTQNGYMTALDCLYRFLIAQGLRKDNPIASMGRPPQQRGLPRPLQMMDAVNYHNSAERLGVMYHALACFGLLMGLRRDEIRKLQWVDFFQAEGRTWLDLEGKGGKRARLAVHKSIASFVLPRLRDEHSDPRWLFPSPRPNSTDCISTSLIRTWHKRILAEAGLEGFVLHQLRHSFASSMRTHGADLAVIQDAMRHTDPKSTRIYMQILPDEVAAAVDRLSFMPNPNKPTAPAEVDGQEGLFGGETA